MDTPGVIERVCEMHRKVRGVVDSQRRCGGAVYGRPDGEWYMRVFTREDAMYGAFTIMNAIELSMLADQLADQDVDLVFLGDDEENPELPPCGQSHCVAASDYPFHCKHCEWNEELP